MEVREARDDAERAEAMAIRHEVFVVEQDGEATHLVAVRDGEVVATCRLIHAGDTVSLGRLAVGTRARRQGVARRLLDAAEAWARARGARRVALSAQTYALGLYLAAGYATLGEPFMEAGIEHIDMELPLA
jgi:predicted GNAT family N-acyltransferase